MTRILGLAAALAVVAPLALARHAPAGDLTTKPTLEAIADTYDAGRVDAGTSVTHTYELRNNGTHPLTLLVKTSCGCTTTDFDETIPAGGTGTVSAALDTTHLRGRTVKTIRVTTNDTTQPALVLTLIAEAIRILDILPTDQPVLRAAVGMLQPLDLTITAPDGAPFEIVRVEDDPLLAARVQPDAATAPTSAGTPDATGAAVRPGRHRFTLTPQRDLAVGTYTPTVTLVTTHPKAERFPLRATIVVTGPLATMPTQLRIDSAASPGSVRVFTESAGVSFRVLRVESTDTDFTPQVVTVDDGRTYDVTLRYTGRPERRGPVNGVLKMTTDEPSQPLLLVRFSGQLTATSPPTPMPRTPVPLNLLDR